MQLDSWLVPIPGLSLLLRDCVPADWGLHAGHGGSQRGHGPAAETEHRGGPESAIDSGVLGCWGWIGEASRCLRRDVRESKEN